MKHQSQLPPADNKFHQGNGEDGKHYWITPPELYASLHAEFQFTFDPCPWPLPAGFDGLTCEWGQSNYVNPPFGSIIHEGRKKGPTWWVKKAIAEQKKGKRTVLVYPVDKWVLMLLKAGAQVRNLGDVKWLATEDGTAGKGTGRHIACFVLEPENQIDTIPTVPQNQRTVIRTSPMKITLELDLGPNPDPMALSQWLMWAARSDVHTQYSEMKIPASMRKAGDETVAAATPSAPPIRASGNGAAPYTPLDIDPQFTAPGAEDEAEVEEPVTTHAVPPGVTPPVAPKRRGRPPKVKAEEVSAPSTQPFTPPAGAAIPPGVNAAPPAAAMPHVEPSTGAATLTDLQEALKALHAHDPKLSFQLLRAKFWSDNEPKPSWFGANQVPEEYRERLIEEIQAAIQ